MPTNIDQVFSGHFKAMTVNRQRLQLIASNIANEETPGFKAQDLDFRAALDEAGNGTMRLAATRRGHIGQGQISDRPLVAYRTAEQPSADGNTVDSHKEKTAFAEASVRYQASLTFLNRKISGLRAAITGGR